MKRFIPILIAVALLVSLGIGMSVAGGANNDPGHPSAKATAVAGNLTVLGFAPGTTSIGWTDIMENTIKTPNGKDLFIDVSLECGLYTETFVKSKGGTKDRSTADAMVMVRVLIDGEEASPVWPGEVVFAQRYQELEAEFAGILYEECITVSCNPLDPSDCTVTIDPDCLGNETLRLIQKTMSANSFNFIEENLSAGVHTVTVQAMIASDTSVQQGEADAWAMIGLGSVTVEEVRMIKGEDIVTLPN
jgi:hypothetical protein